MLLFLETLANSLSAAPKKIEKDLLPALDEVYHNSDVDTDEEDNFTGVFILFFK